MSDLLGVVFRPDYQPAGLRDVARAAEAAGVDELWLWEDCFQQGGVAQAAVALASTERLGVGVGLIPAPLRNVATAAMEFATLEAMFPGRTRVAVGHGVQSWMQQAGVKVASPMTLLREYVTALRELLAGRSVSVDGRYVRLSEVTLEYPAAGVLPVLIGGTGPKTLRLAGEIADGVLLDAQYTPDTVREALTHVAAGRAESSVQAFSNTLFAVGDEGGTVPDAVGLRDYYDAGIDSLALQSAGGLAGMGAFVAAAGRVRTGL